MDNTIKTLAVGTKVKFYSEDLGKILKGKIVKYMAIGTKDTQYIDYTIQTKEAVKCSDIHMVDSSKIID